MKKKFNVDTVENALIQYELDHQFKLNCDRFALACCIVDYMNQEG